MMDVVSATYNKAAADDTMVITEWDLPAPYGFVWLDKPLVIIDQGLLTIRRPEEFAFQRFTSCPAPRYLVQPVCGVEWV